MGNAGPGDRPTVGADNGGIAAAMHRDSLVHIDSWRELPSLATTLKWFLGILVIVFIWLH